MQKPIICGYFAPPHPKATKTSCSRTLYQFLISAAEIDRSNLTSCCCCYCYCSFSCWNSLLYWILFFPVLPETWSWCCQVFEQSLCSCWWNDVNLLHFLLLLSIHPYIFPCDESLPSPSLIWLWLCHGRPVCWTWSSCSSCRDRPKSRGATAGRPGGTLKTWLQTRTSRDWEWQKCSCTWKWEGEGGEGGRGRRRRRSMGCNVDCKEGDALILLANHRKR